MSKIEEEEYDYDLKITFVGDSKVGKTSLINQLINQKFEPDPPSTVGGGNFIKQLTLNTKRFLLTIWDTAGQERYRSLSKLFLKNSSIVIFVYDITNIESFNSIKNNWYPLINDILGINDIIFGLVGNKSDLYDFDTVGIENGKSFANEINALFFETTAKNYDCVENLIIELVKKYALNLGSFDKKDNINIYINKKQSKVKKKICCKK